MIDREILVERWAHERSAERRGEVIESHRYLCVRAARKFVRDGLDRSDLEQVAAIGLIKAVDRFDTRVRTPFEAYAWVLVLGELMHYVRDCERVLRAPRRLRELERRWVCAERELCALLGREPNEGEIAQFVGINGDEYRDVRLCRATANVLSVDVLRPFEERSLAYTIDTQLDRLVLESALARLTPLERKILEEIYDRDTPVAELATQLGYSRRHVTRLHRMALNKLSGYTRPFA